MIQMVMSVACEQIFWRNDFRMAKITIKTTGINLYHYGKLETWRDKSKN